MVSITSPLRRNKITTSFWHINDAIMTSYICREREYIANAPNAPFY